jgi:hypothetical protein
MTEKDDMDNRDGLRIALSPEQLDAILSGEPINLMPEEDPEPAGGHTIRKHVGWTEAQLRARLEQEPIRSEVSTFPNLGTAEWALNSVIRANQNQIHAWDRSLARRRLVIQKNVWKIVGRVLLRETGEIYNAKKVTAILVNQEYNGMPYFMLTAHIGLKTAMAESRYPELWQLILGYFNEDSNEWGSDVEEIVRLFRRESIHPVQYSAILEIDKFKADNINLDAAFRNEFGGQFNPNLWGYTTASFLDEVKQLLEK